MLSRKTPPQTYNPGRLTALTVFLCACFAIIVIRLVFLQVVSAGDYRRLAEDQYALYKTLTPVRGEIKVVDKFSNEPYVVATSIEKDLVYAVPASITNPEEVAEKLGPVIGLEPKDILVKISDKSKKYVPLKKQLTEEEEQKIKDLHLTGVAFEPETLRYYPEKDFLSHVLGYVGYKDDHKTGFYGLEQAFNEELAGRAGSVDQEKDAGGAWIFGTRRNIVPAVNGDNLVLTIDKTIQFKAEEVLRDAVDKHGADSGSVIVLDPKTGAVQAMATYPDFDPNAYNKVKSIDVFNNLSTVGNYEPGSVFKAITMAAAVDKGKVSPATTYVDTGSIVVDDYTLKNSDLKAHGLQTMSQVLEESLNTGAIFAKDQIGNEEFLKYIKRFGFGVKTGVELPEAKGDIGNLSGNIKVNFATAAFGQGISVTPIQLAQAYTALANHGVMMKPYIIQSKIDPGGKVTNTEPQKVDQVISDKTASMLTAMLINVVELGHGKRAGVPGYYVAGKTGTAQVPRKDGRGYEANNNIGTFAGYAPADDPKFVMLVRIDHPRDVTFAESTAAPAWGQIAQFLLNYYNVPPNRTVKK
jgi:cell division protein FtsI/penicillin-binding protein 2